MTSGTTPLSSALVHISCPSEDSAHHSATTFTITKLCIFSHSPHLTLPSIILQSSASEYIFLQTPTVQRPWTQLKPLGITILF